jgi:hypothetical protein
MARTGIALAAEEHRAGRVVNVSRIARKIAKEERDAGLEIDKDTIRKHLRLQKLRQK